MADLSLPPIDGGVDSAMVNDLARFRALKHAVSVKKLLCLNCQPLLLDIYHRKSQRGNVA